MFYNDIAIENDLVELSFYTAVRKYGLTPGLENYGTLMEYSTSLSQEGLIDKIKSLFLHVKEKIKNTFRRVKERVINFKNRLFKSKMTKTKLLVIGVIIANLIALTVYVLNRRRSSSPAPLKDFEFKIHSTRTIVAPHYSKLKEPEKVDPNNLATDSERAQVVRKAEELKTNLEKIEKSVDSASLTSSDTERHKETIGVMSSLKQAASFTNDSLNKLNSAVTAEQEEYRKNKYQEIEILVATNDISLINDMSGNDSKHKATELLKRGNFVKVGYSDDIIILINQIYHSNSGSISTRDVDRVARVTNVALQRGGFIIFRIFINRVDSSLDYYNSLSSLLNLIYKTKDSLIYVSRHTAFDDNGNVLTPTDLSRFGFRANVKYNQNEPSSTDGIDYNSKINRLKEVYNKLLRKREQEKIYAINAKYHNGKLRPEHKTIAESQQYFSDISVDIWKQMQHVKSEIERLEKERNGE